MRYIDGTVEAGNVNKIALDLEYTFVRRVFRGKNCIYRVYGILDKEDNSTTASSINFFQSYFCVSRR